MRITSVNNTNQNYKNIQSGNQPAFGMNYSEFTKKRFAEVFEKLSIETCRKIKELNKRQDGFILDSIGMTGDDSSGFDALLTLIKEGREYKKSWSISDAVRMPEVIEQAVNYLSDLPQIMRDFTNCSKPIVDAAAVAKSEAAERAAILDSLA